MKGFLGAAIGALLAGMAVPAEAADTVHLGKAVGVAWTFLAADVGIAEGVFARYGIAADVVSFGGDAKLQQALAAKSIDFGLGSGPSMAFVVKGAPVIAVAAFADEPRNISVVVGADSPVKTVADLKGRLVAVSTTGSLTEWLVKRIATTEGWGPDGIRDVAIGDAPAQVAAIRSHQVDAMMGSTEYAIGLEERGEARRIVGMERYAPHFITHVIYARRDLLAANPDLVNRFLKAFFASIEFIRTHKEETVKIAMPIEQLSAEVLAKAQDLEQPMMESDGEFDPQGLALIKQSFVEMRILDREPRDDEMLTRQFLPVRP